MHSYGVHDVERLLRLSRNAIRAFVAAGFVTPGRGPRNTWLFSFQDLILLRTAQALADAKVPLRRITRSMKELRRHLPESMPLSGLSIGAVGERVVVREGVHRWQAESGQYLLEFEGDPANDSLKVVRRETPVPAPADAEAWYDRGVAFEEANPQAAIEAYERTIAADPSRLDARINLGRLLHETGRLASAEQAYRDALRTCGSDPVLLFNLGVLFEDMSHKHDAMQAYQAALRINPQLADCHYNLALIYERLRRPKEALRHMAQYRRLSR
jgi:tetratricopeptide (TPR) repeat protein